MVKSVPAGIRRFTPPRLSAGRHPHRIYQVRNNDIANRTGRAGVRVPLRARHRGADNTEARNLQADAYEQLGYQAEGPQWRGICLSAARELRAGISAATVVTASEDTIVSMPIDLLFDYAAVHVAGEQAAKADVRIAFHFEDAPEADQSWHMWIRRGVLNARRGDSEQPAPLTLAGPKIVLAKILSSPADGTALAEKGLIRLDGDASALTAYADLVEDYNPRFPIVTP